MYGPSRRARWSWGVAACLATVALAPARALGSGPDAVQAPAEGPVALLPGTVVPQVPCARNPGQSYALYLPAAYTPERAWPVLFAFDARQRGSLVVERFREQAEALGVVIVSSNNSRSDTSPDPNPAAMRAMWEDAHERFRIDPRRIYATGFSGGARAAVMLATVRPGEVAGVIAVGGGFPFGWQPSAETPFALYGLAAEGDFNFTELRKLDRTFAELGLPHAFETFPGTHGWPPPERCGEALAWLESLAARRDATLRDDRFLDERLRAGRARAGELESAGDLIGAVRRYESLIAELAGRRATDEDAAAAARLRSSSAYLREEALERRGEEEFDRFVQQATREMALALQTPADEWRLAATLSRLGTERLKRRAAEDPSPTARRTALQSLEALVVQTGFYLPESRAAAGDHRGAARCLEVATAVRPESPWLWYQLGQQRALAGERRAALAALARAVTAGFDDGALLAHDEAFATLRDEAKFRELVAKLTAGAGS